MSDEDQDEGDRCWKCLFTPDTIYCRKGNYISSANDPVCVDYIGSWSERGEELKAEGFNEKSNDDVHKDFGQDY